MGNETPKSNGTIGFKENDGLLLTGLVVASQVIEKSYEGKHYKQLKLTISNGLKSFFYVLTDRFADLPVVETFKRVRIDVESANSEGEALPLEVLWLMNKIDALLSAEQLQVLESLALRFRVGRAELLAAAALSRFENAELGPEFDGLFMEDIRRYLQEKTLPRVTS